MFKRFWTIFSLGAPVDGTGDFVQNKQPVYNPILTVGKGWFPLTRFWLRTLKHVNLNQ